MKEFRTLNMAIAQYHEIKKLTFKGEIKDQIQRAALSVCLNLSEGNAKAKTLDRKRFFNIAYASQKEVFTILLIENTQSLYQKADHLSASIFKLYQHAK